MKEDDFNIKIYNNILDKDKDIIPTTKRKRVVGRPSKDIKDKLTERLILTFTSLQLERLKQDFKLSEETEFTKYLRKKLLKDL